jgi:SAM-dependent methyltransferase
VTGIHRSAAEGFSAGAGTYARGRPDYPAELDAWLWTDLAMGPGSVALDLGAGTGKFLPRIVATGASALAVDPVPAMLAQLRARFPDVDAREGSAERLPLDDGSVDAVVCAQSFHWFASASSLAEIHRVLRPGGALGLVWNVRDERVPWVAALTRILDPHEGDAPRYRTQAWRRCFPAAGFGPLVERLFPNAHRGTPDEVIVDRALSVSFIAALPQDERDRVAAQVRALIAATPELVGKGEVVFSYETATYACRRLSQAGEA